MDKVFDLLKENANWQTVLIVVLLYLVWNLITNPEKGEKYKLWFYSMFFWLCKPFARQRVAKELEVRINETAFALDKECPGACPYGIKIKWFDPVNTTREAFLERKSMVVRIDHHRNQARNFVVAVMHYVPEALLRPVKTLIDRQIGAAVDLTFAKKILRAKEHQDKIGVLNIFSNEYVLPAFEKEPQLRNYCQSMEALDEIGLLTRVYLKELMRLQDAGTRLGDNSYATDSKGLLEMLNRLPDKEKGEDVYPTYLGSELRVAIEFVARPEKLDYGPDRYVAYFRKCSSQGMRAVYLIARGKRNLLVAVTLSKILAANGDAIVDVPEYFPYRFPDGTQVPAVLIRACPSRKGNAGGF